LTGQALHGLAALLWSVGLTPVAAAALALLLIERRELSLTEIARRIGYAKSHVSAHLKVLAGSGLVECKYAGRKIVYRARESAVADLLRNYFASLKNRLDTATTNLSDGELKHMLARVSVKLGELIREVGGERD